MNMLQRNTRAALAGVLLLGACGFEDTLGPVPVPATYDLLVEEANPITNRTQLTVRQLPSGTSTLLFGYTVLGGMPDVSADGQRVVFVGPSSGADEDDYQDLWTVAPGELPRRLPLSLGPENSPSLSPDGQRIAFIRLDANGEPGLFTANMIGTNERRVSPAIAPGVNFRVASPAWSPDGTRLLFSAGEPGRLHLWIARPDGSAVQQVTNAGISDIDGTWSPDGRSVAFTRAATPAVSQIMIRRLDTGAEQMFALSHRSRHPAWSPDGTRLAFVSNFEDNADLELYTMRIDGEGLTRHTWDELRQQSPRWIRR